MSHRGRQGTQCSSVLGFTAFLAAATLALVLSGKLLVPADGEVAAAWEAPVTSAGVVMASDGLSYTVYLPQVFRGYAPPPLPSAFGVQMYGTLDETSNALNLARSARIYWVRWPISWRYIEPSNATPNAYIWASTDANIQRANASGHKMIITIADAPEWAAQYPQGPIHRDKLPDFAEFIGELVERYDGDGNRDAPGSPVVDHFEFFNEPDSSNIAAAEAGYHSLYGPHADWYAELLCTVYPVIKFRNTRASVLFGGIAYDYFVDEGGSFNPEFLDEVLRAGGGPCFDVMNFHYYPAFAGRWNPDGMGLTGKASNVRSILAAYGFGAKPMVVTEAGWRSNQYGATDLPGTPEIQSAFVVQLYVQAAASRLSAMTWWSWIDIGWPWGDMGLITKGLTPKLSHGVYGVAADRIGQARFESTVQSDHTLENYRFTSRSGRAMYVVWTNDNLNHTVTFPMAQATVANMYGGTIAYLSDSADGVADGRVRFVAGPYPVYVEALP